MPDDSGTTPDRFARIVVQGTSGSGKTSLSSALATVLGSASIELDGLYHQADWTPLDVDVFRARVATFVEQPRWIVDGNYSQVRDITWPLASVIVFINLPKRVVMTRLIKRTLVRIVKREHLWNDNRESWRNVLSRDPNRNIILWAWHAYANYLGQVPQEARDVVGPDRVLVLRSAREVRQFLHAASLGR